MSALCYTKFDCNGEWLGFVDYIDRIMGTPHPPRTSKEEEELAVQNAMEPLVISVYRNARGSWDEMFADCVKNEITLVVNIVHRYTWLSEDCIWKLAYEILWWKTITEEGEE